MTTVAVLPVKRFDRAKQRLSSGLEGSTREALAEAMVGDVLRALSRVRALHAIVVVTAEPRAQALARAHDAVTVEDPAEAGQSAAATLGVARAVELGAGRVLMVPGDCPALDADEVEALVARQAGGGEAAVTIVPDRHGTGTNALLLAPPDVIAPAFGEGSFARHLAAATASRARVAVEHVASLALDVDTPDDLDALRRAPAPHDGLRQTTGVLGALAQRRA